MQKYRPRPETVFSIIINVSDCVIGTNYSDINIMRTCGGIGTSGLVTASLSFAVPKEDYGVFRPATRAPRTTIIMTPTESNTTIPAPTFYVDSRVVSGGKVKFTCYDRMAFADSIYFMEDDLEDVPELAAAMAQQDHKITALVLVTVIARKMNITFSGGLEVGCIKDIDVEALPGTSCADWLDKLAAVQCGFFYINNSDQLEFARFNEECGRVSMTQDYTKPDIGDTLIISELIVSGDSGRRYEHTYDEDPGGLVINVSGGSLVDSTTSENLARSILGTTYTYWSVEKAIIWNVPLVNSYCNLYGSTDDDIPVNCLANNISLSISSAGIIASLSANSAGGGEIGQAMGKITRQLENTIKANEKIGKHLVIPRYQLPYYEDDDDEED